MGEFSTRIRDAAEVRTSTRTRGAQCGHTVLFLGGEIPVRIVDLIALVAVAIERQRACSVQVCRKGARCVSEHAAALFLRTRRPPAPAFQGFPTRVRLLPCDGVSTPPEVGTTPPHRLTFQICNLQRFGRDGEAVLVLRHGRALHAQQLHHVVGELDGRLVIALARAAGARPSTMAAASGHRAPSPAVAAARASMVAAAAAARPPSSAAPAGPART